jgi:hypothetical protein
MQFSLDNRFIPITSLADEGVLLQSALLLCMRRCITVTRDGRIMSSLLVFRAHLVSTGLLIGFACYHVIDICLPDTSDYRIREGDLVHRTRR